MGQDKTTAQVRDLTLPDDTVGFFVVDGCFTSLGQPYDAGEYVKEQRHSCDGLSNYLVLMKETRNGNFRGS